jgi:hypothetical protein
MYWTRYNFHRAPGNDCFREQFKRTVKKMEALDAKVPIERRNKHIQSKKAFSSDSTPPSKPFTSFCKANIFS